ncbi:hypothetical protein [Crocosphaera chwakensis]|uniref:Uncharacterized protein n=1 Tax=Crocosphaera chwakensis CCY0110 TaxID=391612 RepID=A3IZA7_9CHRO|nr:hypothetical protein [Crocosphaera chwakensis]EAZ88198.1 hypothetical protein CY0110_14695 [Crocosphaera chwakensis CCY0110]
MMIQPILLQANNSFGANSGINILSSADALMRANATAWNALWDDAVSSNSFLWEGLIGIGNIFIVIGIIWTAYKKSNEIFNEAKYDMRAIIQMVIPFFFIGILMLNKGIFLANSIRLVRTVSYHQISRLYQQQVAGISLQDAVNSLAQTQAANTRTQQIFADCVGKSGQALQDCMSSPDKVNALQQVMAGSSNALPGNVASLLCGLISVCGIIQNTGSVIQGVTQGLSPSQIMQNMFISPFISIAQSILQALQWAVVNSLELALLLTALFAPIAVGLSALPIAGRMFWTWASGFLAILAINLGYSILTGLMAITVVSMTSASGILPAFRVFLKLFLI